MTQKKSQIKAGAILSYIQLALTIVVELLYTPIMIKCLGKSEYGLYNTVASTISMLSILSLGFNSSYIKFYAKYKKENDESGINSLNGIFLSIFIVIGLVALACGLFLTRHLDIVFANGLNEIEYNIAEKLMLLLTINLAISFPMGVFSNIISANEKFIYLKLVGMLKTIAGPMVTIPLLLMGYRSIAIVVVTILISLIADVLYIYYVFDRLRCRFTFTTYDKKLYCEMFVYTSFIAINIVVDQINLNVDNVILGRFRGTTEVAVYAVGYTLYRSYVRFSQAISGVFTPRIHTIVNSAYNNQQLKKELTDLFVRVGRIQFFILSLIALGFIFFGKPFIAIWAGNGYEISYYVALMLIIPGTIPLIQNLGIEIQRAQNLHRFRSIAYLFMAVINIVLSWFLAQKWGAIGSTIGTAISFIVANGLIMNTYYHKRCNIDTIVFWKAILNLSKAMLLPICFGIFYNVLFEISSLYSMMVGILFFTIVYIISIWILGMNNTEKDLIIKLLIKARK